MNRYPLYYASRYGYGEIVSQLVEKGAHIAVAQNEQGWTPLHIAGYYGLSACLSVCPSLTVALLRVRQPRQGWYTPFHSNPSAAERAAPPRCQKNKESKEKKRSDG